MHTLVDHLKPHYGFDAALQKARTLSTPPLFSLSDVHKLDYITAYAKDSGFFTLDEASLTEDRLTKAQGLTQLCMSHPTRTQVLSRILPDQGILSSKKRGDKARLVFERIQDTENRVHFTFGLPYFFDSYDPQYDARFNQMAIAVLNGDAILERPDLQIPFVDTGLLIKTCNPLGAVISQLEKERPEFIRTDTDPTKLLYEYILRDPKRSQRFLEWMKQMYPRYCLTRQDLPIYLTKLLSSSFPFNITDHDIARKWRTIRCPEGNVEGSIGIEEIAYLIVSDSMFEHVRKTYPSHIKIVSAGQPYSVTENTGRRGISNLHLLEKYAEVVGAQSELQYYIHFLKNGEGRY